MNVVVYDSLASLPDKTRKALSFPSTNDFFSAVDWHACLFAEVVSKELSLRIYCLEDLDKSPIAVLFCACEPGRQHLSSLTNFYTIHYSPVCPVESDTQCRSIERIIDYIGSERPRWKQIEFRYLQDEMKITQCLIDGLRRKYVIEEYMQYENWRLNINNRTFEEYYLERPSRLKNTISRKEKKLIKNYNMEMVIYREDNEQLQEAIEHFQGIYESSWKQNEPYTSFIPSLIRQCAVLGVLRLGVLYLDRRAVASQFWITTEKVATIYKLAYDEEFKSLSPGSVLSKEMFREAIDIDGVEEIDYGVGSENYKRDWMEFKESVKGVRVFNIRTISGFIGAINLFGRKVLKSLLKKKYDSELKQ